MSTISNRFQKSEGTNNDRVHLLDIKEVGFLLSLMDESHHAGKHLELALQIKLKLQDKLNNLMENKELI